MRAKSFAEREIRYTLKATGQGAGTFNIGPTTGNVRLAKDLDFEDLRQPHVYQLQVTATEDSGGFSTSVEVNFIFFPIARLPFNFDQKKIVVDDSRDGCERQRSQIRIARLSSPQHRRGHSRWHVYPQSESHRL